MTRVYPESSKVGTPRVPHQGAVQALIDKAVLDYSVKHSHDEGGFLGDLGDAAYLDVGLTEGTVAAGDDSRFPEGAFGNAAYRDVGETDGTVAAGDDGRLQAAYTAVQPEALGNAATLDVGTTTGTVAAGDDARLLSIDTVMATVAHAEDASMLRPIGPLIVYWLGVVEPTYATDGDFWISTAIKVKQDGVFYAIIEGVSLVSLFSDTTLILATEHVESGWFDFQTLGVTTLLITRSTTPDTYGFKVDWSDDGITVAVTEDIVVPNDTSVSKTIATRYGRVRMLNTDSVDTFTVHNTVVTGR